MTGIKRSIFRDAGTHCSLWQPCSEVGFSQRRCELRGRGVWGGVGGEIAGAGRVVDWWARIKRSLARNGFADELV